MMGEMMDDAIRAEADGADSARINLERARGLLARAVLTQGSEFVYNPDGKAECLYVPVGYFGPQSITGCLVGVALDLAGETVHQGFSGMVTGIRDMYPGMLTSAATLYLAEAQTVQDHGGTWGKAYQEAENIVTNAYALMGESES